MTKGVVENLEKAISAAKLPAIYRADLMDLIERVDITAGLEAGNQRAF